MLGMVCCDQGLDLEFALREFCYDSEQETYFRVSISTLGSISPPVLQSSMMRGIDLRADLGPTTLTMAVSRAWSSAFGQCPTSVP